MSATHMPITTDPGLAMAMVLASPVPTLLLDGGMTVVAASVSFSLAFYLPAAEIVGQPLFELGGGEWNAPRLRSLMNATASGGAAITAYEMDLKQADGPRHLVLGAHKLSYDDSANIRVLLTITDVTALREAAAIARKTTRDNEVRYQDLQRDNELLMQEVRHRVANSLQIIASVMMQNARRTQSEEIRAHLRDAHQRVMSVAELQQQLDASTAGTTNIRTYLTKLCETIAASMIADPTEISLSVKASDVMVDAEVSVSIGLIITELVINSLKHAFPVGTGGAIVVDYVADGDNWRVCVADTGIGIPKPGPDVMPGLGTSIVQALARQLRATVQAESANPGARISIVHNAAAPVAPYPDLSQPEPAA